MGPQMSDHKSDESTVPKRLGRCDMVESFDPRLGEVHILRFFWAKSDLASVPSLPCAACHAWVACFGFGASP